MTSIPEDKQQFERKLAQLSRTQRPVLNLFVQGYRDEVIAESLGIQPSSVRSNIRNIANVLGIPSDSSDKGFRRREIVQLFRRFAPEQVASSHYCDDSWLVSTRTSTTLEPSIAIELEAVDQLGRNDHNFVGRLEAIAALDGFRERGSKLVQIVAAGGQGKTTLARKYLQNRFAQVIEFRIPREDTYLVSVERLLHEKLYEIGIEPGQEFMISLERLKQKLQSDPIGILIDNLESVLDAEGRIVENHRSYVELLRMLGESNIQSFTIITTSESLSEYNPSSTEYRLKPLSLDDWKIYFNKNQVRIEDHLLEKMYDSCCGMAKAMEIFAGKGKLLDIYWQTIFQDPFSYEPVLKNLAFDSVYAVFNKKPNLIKLVNTHGKTISLRQAEDIFDSNEKVLWSELNRYSLGEWSENGREFQIYDFFYQKILDIYKFESGSHIDSLTGNSVQCQAQNQNFLQDLSVTFPMINGDIKYTQDTEYWLLDGMNNYLYIQNNKLEEINDTDIFSHGSSSSYVQKQNNDMAPFPSAHIDIDNKSSNFTDELGE